MFGGRHGGHLIWPFTVIPGWDADRIPMVRRGSRCRLGKAMFAGIDIRALGDGLTVKRADLGEVRGSLSLVSGTIQSPFRSGNLRYSPVPGINTRYAIFVRISCSSSRTWPRRSSCEYSARRTSASRLSAWKYALYAVSSCLLESHRGSYFQQRITSPSCTETHCGSPWTMLLSALRRLTCRRLRNASAGWTSTSASIIFPLTCRSLLSFSNCSRAKAASQRIVI